MAIAVITGSSTGIGFAASVTLARADIFIYKTFGGNFSGATLPWYESISAGIIARIVGAVDTLQAAGPVMIVAARVPALAASGEAATAEIGETNTQLAAELATRGVPLIDTFAFLNDPNLLRFTSSGIDLMVGDYAMPIVPWSVAKASGLIAPDDPRAIGPCRIVGPEWRDAVGTSNLMCGTLEYQLNAQLDDGIHPSTLAMGLMANEYVKAFNSNYGLEIRPLTSEDILAAAGIVKPEEEDGGDE